MDWTQAIVIIASIIGVNSVVVVALHRQTDKRIDDLHQQTNKHVDNLRGDIKEIREDLRMLISKLIPNRED